MSKKNIVLEPGPAQAIAEIQIQMLLEKAKERPLSLEEVKIYDMLVKNLNISKGEATSIVNAQYRQIEAQKQEIPTEVLVEKALELKSPEDPTDEK